ncbi:MAG: hypothetical protein U0835_22055 [Isosphaeraceae bacterium]
MRKADVLAAAKAAPPTADAPAGRSSGELDPPRDRRAARGGAMRESAPVTLTTTVDASNLVNLRGQFKVELPRPWVAALGAVRRRPASTPG